MTDQSAAPVDQVTVTIDGIAVTVPKGTLIIRAAEMLGITIPRFCDHPLLAPVGACRQCLVEVAMPGPGGEMRQMQGPPGRMKPQASCTMTVAEGMEVKTQVTSAGAAKAQAGIMEFLLINHPLDCPICDKGGECPLQNQAMTTGRGDSRFHETKRTYPKPINISAQVLLDRERCVLCARCTRFSAQIAGDPFIALIERGALQQVGIYEEQPFESYFSGNTIQICPVGALTSAEYRFRSRPFDLVSTPAVAEHDACGSAIRVDHRRGRVMRRLAGNDPEVNEEWITDKDRFAFTYAQTADRLSHPQVRDSETGELRPASWPEAFVVAARGLAAAGAVGVLPGGRVTVEDAYGYAKFARVALGTNDIDFRARPHSAEEAGFLASRVAPAAEVTYADLEAASVVVLAGLEPEDEAGAIFLRLRKASLRSGTRVVSVAPYTSRGLAKLNARLIPTAPGAEPAALAALARDPDATLDADAVILVGERLATVPGALSAVVRLAGATGARLAWVPRRAGDRGAVAAGCLPNLLPGGRPVTDAAARVDLSTAWGVDQLPDAVGRDASAIVAAAADGSIGGLVVGGVDPDDDADPARFRAALDAVGFLVSVELRPTAVTERADVVFPAAAVVEKAGTFVNWEGRHRSFEAALATANAQPDLRILSGIADEMHRPLGLSTPGEARAELAELGPWDGEPAEFTPTAPAKATTGAGFAVATWKPMLDDGSLQAGEPHLAATARRVVCRLPRVIHDALGEPDEVVLDGNRGQVTLPVEAVDDLVGGTVWVPTKSFGHGVYADLASPGSKVAVKGVTK